MARVQLENVKKIYQGKVTAVHDFNLDIKDKEFVVFVGPSGCGKSTTLRMVAGLEDISEGICKIDDVVVNDLLPKDRHISMVFQNYALYPHLTVFENMAFPLRLDKTVRVIPWTEEEIQKLNVQLEVAKSENNDKKIKAIEEKLAKGHVIKGYTQDEIFEKVTDAAKVLDITKYLTRKPKALSGGQRQRVAIGRAMVKDCKVFLMDEPLSNLDAKLRNQMRAEIILLRKRINTTFIYVTHDQTEAMTLGDRIVCMRDGFIMQVGTPSELFDMPDNLFVAQFIGAPMMNTFNTELVREGKSYSINLFDVKIPVTGEKGEMLLKKDIKSRPILLGVRPEHMALSVKQDKASIPVVVEVCEMMGSEIHVHVTTKDETKIIVRIPTINMTAEEKEKILPGNEVYLSFESKAMHFFDPEDEKNLLAGPNAVNSKGPIVLPGEAPVEKAPVETAPEEEEAPVEEAPVEDAPLEETLKITEEDLKKQLEALKAAEEAAKRAEEAALKAEEEARLAKDAREKEEAERKAKAAREEAEVQKKNVIKRHNYYVDIEKYNKQREKREAAKAQAEAEALKHKRGPKPKEDK